MTISSSVSKINFEMPFPDSKSLFFTSSDLKQSPSSSNDFTNLNGLKNKNPPNCTILES